MKLIIENCEEKLWHWLYLEYKHASEIWEGNVIFTNVKDFQMYNKLKDLGEVYRESFIEIFDDSKIIILDPLAEKQLETEDFIDMDYVLIGGILGDRRITGKTRELITKKAKNAKVRNLGKIQLTIDSAALVAKLIYLGMKLEDIEITSEVEIRLNDVESIHLPYGYVILNGKPIITPGLIDYLINKLDGELF